MAVIDGTPWFVAADVCRALGFALSSGIFQHLVNLTKAENRLIKGADLPNNFLGSASVATIISESGLYKLVLRAQRKNEAARKFQDWVTGVVLPAAPC